jgi:hypothetical protein
MVVRAQILSYESHRHKVRQRQQHSKLGIMASNTAVVSELVEVSVEIAATAMGTDLCSVQHEMDFYHSHDFY